MSTQSFRILPSSHDRGAREDFAAAAELERRLRARLPGSEVRFDAGSRALYATDASNYRQIPIGLVIPRETAAVEATLEVCREFGAPVLARGGGTSLAGQCCNVAVVLDFSKYLNRLLELDPAARRARVEPGIVLDRVREAAERHGLTFAPDPATHNRCTLGGMIGNNSCGVHALMGGKTVDNIESLEILLYDGTRMRVGPTAPAELAAIVAAGGRRGQIYAGLARLRDTYADEIRRRFPRIPRRVSGYNLDELLPENGFNVARALVGSEGTCATVLEATLELRPSPPHRALVGLGFDDAFIAADHVPQVLEFRPIGLEGLDGLLLDGMRAKNLLVEDLELIPAGRGFLLVEFGAESAAAAAAQAHDFKRALEGSRARPAVRVYSNVEARRVWRVRESGLGASAIVPGKPNGWEGWEDSAVAPEKLGAYLRAIQALMDRFGYQAAMYGHYGQGCVHMRINFDLESDPGVLAFRQFVDAAADVVLAHGGSLSGEHGDGQARGALLPKMFGPELMRAFQDFKRLWDPDLRMNPGKLVDAREPHADLRFGADYHPLQPATHFHFAADQGSFAHAASRCVGVGLCRKHDGGAMCPSYMVTRDERHSTRGRAHLLWELMQGEVLESGWRNPEVKEALDLCLSCKACKRECPVGVDMATYKAEFLAHYYQGRLRPLAAYAFGRTDLWARLASRVAPLANALGQSSLLAAPAKALLGIHPERRLPRVARAFTRGVPAPVAGPPVILWADTFNNYLHPQALRAAHAVLGDAGFAVEVPRRALCCGRPLYDFGMLDLAKRYLRRVLDALAPALAAATPVVVLEPSCASVFRDELVNLLPGDVRAAQLQRQTYLLSEFLVQRAPHYQPPRIATPIIVHGHCHHHALMKMDAEMTLLRATGAAVELLDSGCCGMAGPFGFEKDKFEVSQALGERVLLPRVRAAAADALVVSDGFSCREQIAQNTSRRALHLAEVLAGARRGN